MAHRPLSGQLSTNRQARHLKSQMSWPLKMKMVFFSYAQPNHVPSLFLVLSILHLLFVCWDRARVWERILYSLNVQQMVFPTNKGNKWLFFAWIFVCLYIYIYHLLRAHFITSRLCGQHPLFAPHTQCLCYCFSQQKRNL